MNKTISLLILASAALHVLVLGLIDFNSPAKVISAGSLMRISIQAPSPASIQKARSNKNIAKPDIKPVKKKAVVVKTEQPELTYAKVKTETKAETVTEYQNTELSSEKDRVVAKLETRPVTTDSALPSQVSSLLYSDLERAFALHFYYPRMAIKRGWQGEVKISLRIEADGHLTRVRLLNSSGYSLLDKAAMASIDKVEILPTAIALLDGQSLDLVLPVEYRLL